MTVPKIELIHFPCDDSPKAQKQIQKADTGLHHYFRRVKEGVQTLFASQFDYENTPNVFVFGSPHIDNYAKTNTGIGLIDFDRAYWGPYAWDLFVVLLSLSLRQAKSPTDYLKKSVTQNFLDGYLQAYSQPEDNFSIYQPLADQKPKAWQLDGNAYLSAEKKWAKKLFQHPLPADDAYLKALVKGFIEHSDDKTSFASFKILHAGRAPGSMGRVHNIIALEQSKTKQIRLIDIKPTKDYLINQYSYNQFYKNLFNHDGIRMIAASDLHAPGITGLESYLTLNGIEYWGRELPTINIKIKGNLDREQQEHYAYAVGTQIGRSHGLSIKKHHRKQLLKHLTSEYKTINAGAKSIQKQLHIAHQYYLKLLSTNK